MIPKVAPLGDQAMLVSYPATISFNTHQQVLGLQSGIERRQIEGVTFLQPAYCSLTIGFDPTLVSYYQLKQIVRERCHEKVDPKEIKGRLISIPVCYEEPYALDLKEISDQTGLKRKEIIDLHTGNHYQVFMLGFLPGFPYLGVLPEILHLPRKKTPRLKIPEGAVGIAGLQTGIYPASSPGGWNILGSTPLAVFDASSEDPFLLRAGDQVKFKAIGIEEYQRIRGE
jgi:inhibitor of KinA